MYTFILSLVTLHWGTFVNLYEICEKWSGDPLSHDPETPLLGTYLQWKK